MSTLLPPDGPDEPKSLQELAVDRIAIEIRNGNEPMITHSASGPFGNLLFKAVQRHTRINSKTLEWLMHRFEPNEVDISGSAITEEDLKTLSQFKITKFRYSRPLINGLRQDISLSDFFKWTIRDKAQLTSLDLTFLKSIDGNFEVLSNIRDCVNLEQLMLDGVKLHPEDGQRFGVFKKLKVLSVSGTNINTISSLAELDCLRELYLRDVVLSREEADVLQKLKNLVVLDVSRTSNPEKPDPANNSHLVNLILRISRNIVEYKPYWETPWKWLEYLDLGGHDFEYEPDPENEHQLTPIEMILQVHPHLKTIGLFGSSVEYTPNIVKEGEINLLGFTNIETCLRLSQVYSSFDREVDIDNTLRMLEEAPNIDMDLHLSFCKKFIGTLLSYDFYGTTEARFTENIWRWFAFFFVRNQQHGRLQTTEVELLISRSLVYLENWGISPLNDEIENARIAFLGLMYVRSIPLSAQTRVTEYVFGRLQFGVPRPSVGFIMMLSQIVQRMSEVEKSRRSTRENVTLISQGFKTSFDDCQNGLLGSDNRGAPNIRIPIKNNSGFHALLCATKFTMVIDQLLISSENIQAFLEAKGVETMFNYLNTYRNNYLDKDYSEMLEIMKKVLQHYSMQPKESLSNLETTRNIIIMSKYCIQYNIQKFQAIAKDTLQLFMETILRPDFLHELANDLEIEVPRSAVPANWSEPNKLSPVFQFFHQILMSPRYKDCIPQMMFAFFYIANNDAGLRCTMENNRSFLFRLNQVDICSDLVTEVQNAIFRPHSSSN